MRANISLIYFLIFFLTCSVQAQQTNSQGQSAPQAPQQNPISAASPLGSGNPLQQASPLNPASALLPGQGQNVTQGIQVNKVNIDGNNQQASIQNAAQADSIVRQERADPNRKERPFDVSNSSGVTRDGQNQNPEDLTDAERVLSDEFVHQGLAQRKFDEECGKDENKRICRGIEGEREFLGMDSSTVKIIAKAYGMIIGLAGGDLTARSEPVFGGSESGADAGAEGAEGAENTESGEDESQTDYCKYGAVVTEVIATTQQQLDQQEINSVPTNQQTAQAQQLHKAARSHRARAKQAKVQAIGWGGTAVCYTGMLAFAQLDFNLGLKLAGSWLLAGFFKSEIDAHNGYADKVLEIANQLPGKGDCNPITERNCYCSQPETQNDTTHCLPSIQRRLAQKSGIPVSCVDERLRADPACDCRATGTCFAKGFEQKLGDLGFSDIALQGIKPLGDLSNGSLGSANLSSGGLKNAALNRKFRKEAEKKLQELDAPNLSKSQLAEAKAAEAAGVPSTFAKILASQPLNNKGQKFLAGLKAGGKNGKGLFRGGRKKRGNNALVYKGSGNFQAGKRGGKKGENFDFLKNLKGKKKRKTASAKTLRFGDAKKQAALNKAQINGKDTPIFDIISLRYRKSGFKRLDLID